MVIFAIWIASSTSSEALSSLGGGAWILVIVVVGVGIGMGLIAFAMWKGTESQVTMSVAEDVLAEFLSDAQFQLRAELQSEFDRSLTREVGRLEGKVETLVTGLQNQLTENPGYRGSDSARRIGDRPDGDTGPRVSRRS
jgi:hypothetical protein